MAALGKTQEAVYKALVRHGSYKPGHGWYWQNTSTTLRVLDSLVRRGMVVKDERGYYRPTV